MSEGFDSLEAKILDQIDQRLRAWHVVCASYALAHLVIMGVTLVHLNASTCAMPTINSEEIRLCRNFDGLGISITVLEIFLAIIAVSGFWMLRRLTEATAHREARKVAGSAAKDYIQENSDNVLSGPILHRLLSDPGFLKRLGEAQDKLRGAVMATEDQDFEDNDEAIVPPLKSKEESIE